MLIATDRSKPGVFGGAIRPEAVVRCLVFVVCLLHAGCKHTTPSSAPMGPKFMNTEQLEKKILALSDEALPLARELGGTATPVLAKLSHHPDPDVREFNVGAIFQAGAGKGTPLLINAVKDPDINVSSAALRFLHRTDNSGIVSELENELAGHADAYVRGELALIMGRLDTGRSQHVVRLRLGFETNKEVRDRMVLALARLGDRTALPQLHAGLTATDPLERLSVVQSCQYFEKTSALSELRVVLNDEAAAFNANPPHAQPNMIRICDVAVNVVAAAASPKLPFDATERRRFSPEEISKIRSFLQGMVEQ